MLPSSEAAPPRAPDAAAWGAVRGARAVREDGLVDARGAGAPEPSPAPLAPGDAAAWDARLPWREAFEALLASLPEDRRDRLTQTAKESRGAWTLLLTARAGTALHCGNPLSGAVPPLASLGLSLTLLDLSPERLRLALDFVHAQVPGSARGVLGGEGDGLPFEDGQFDVVVHDDEVLSDARAAELRRVCRGELFVACDNRLGYKRSSGRTWDFRVPGPLEFAGGALKPRRGERTLGGWKRRIGGPGFEPPRAFALYPDRRDFAQVVALGKGAPRLFAGPNERRNRLKVAAHGAGLFPVFAPSFGIVARRAGSAPAGTRLDGVLDALSRETGEPRPEAEHLIGTRGNTAVIMTAVPGRDPEDPAGRWLIHVPLHRGHRFGLDVHLATLARVRAEFPGVPVPEALFAGEADGVWLTCERRLPGWASNHLLTGRPQADRVLAQMSAHLAGLVRRPTGVFSAEDFEAVVTPWFERTRRAIRDEGARNSLEGRRQQCARLLIGRELPLVFAHGDLRAKHVQVRADLEVVGYVDWGTVTETALPGLDLIHRIVHDRKQLLGQHEGEAWREVCDPQRLLPGERSALEGYARTLGMERGVIYAVAQVYPAFIGAVIEVYAPFVRTDWYRKQFGV